MKNNSLIKNALTLALTAIFATGCAKLTPPKQMQARIIETTRSSIITTPHVSSLSNSVLLASGLTQETCMADFDACLTDLQSAFFGDTLSRDSLALMAELYYAQAVYLAEQDNCKPTLNRPPIDDYYQNATPDAAAQAKALQLRQDCLSHYQDALSKTIAFSYGYLFFDDLTHNNTHQPIITDNDIRAQDLYHVATNALIQEIYKQQDGAFANAKTTNYPDSQVDAHGQLKVSTISSDDINHTTQNIHLHLSDDQTHLDYFKKYGKDALSDLISIYDYRLADLQVNSARSGLGVGFVGSLQDRYTTSLTQKPSDDTQARIHPMGHLLMTAVIKPKGNTLKQVLSTHDFDVYFFNPYTTKEVSILGKNYPLSANFSSTYATWLSENNLQRVSLLNMIAKKDNTTLPELFMLSPYNPNQKVIIMIHGLASSPATWVNLTNNLLADPILRDHYQVWQIFYPTNLPILENRYQIHQLIEDTFNTTDPTHTNPSSHDAILIGHSMGGIISRMLVSDDNLLNRLNTLKNSAADTIIHDTKAATAQHEDTITLNDSQSQFASQLLTQTYKDELSDRFVLQALPEISTAVFISAPFRGTDYADRWFTRAARRVIHLPLNLTKNVTDTIANIGVKDNIENNLLGSLYLQNGADQLSDRSAFMQLTADIHIKDGVTYHTIMGDHHGLADTESIDVVTEQLSDGIVPYSSSHLDGATSETIITGKHNIHESPKTILQLRKILHEAIGTPHPTPSKDDTKKDVDNKANDNMDNDVDNMESNPNPKNPLMDEIKSVDNLPSTE